MRFQTPLVPARLIRRYKRFLADVRLDAGGPPVVAHCPNPGAMTGLAEPGTRIWVEPTPDPRRKLAWSWRLVEDDAGHFTGIDTALPNRLLRDDFLARRVPGFEGYDTVRPEQRWGSASRIDFRLGGAGLPDAWVEAKSVTLSRRPGLAEFPDTVTERGARHLRELSAIAATGARAALVFVVQRTDADRVTLARDIDPAYAAAFVAARAAGVEVLALRARMRPAGVCLGPVLPVIEGAFAPDS